MVYNAIYKLAADLGQILPSWQKVNPRWLADQRQPVATMGLLHFLRVEKHVQNEHVYPENKRDWTALTWLRRHPQLD